MSDCIILLDPKRFSCLQNKWVFALYMFNDHKLHIMNLMTSVLEVFTNGFGSRLDEGPGSYFVLPHLTFALLVVRPTYWQVLPQAAPGAPPLWQVTA